MRPSTRDPLAGENPGPSVHLKRVGVSSRYRVPWSRKARPIGATFAVVLLALFVVVQRPLPAQAAGISVNLDQFATLDNAWQNGNLNGNNARFPEGGIVPFRLAIEGLKAGSHTIHINYDFTAGGHKAYDFLATWSGWVHPNPCGPSGGGISSMCPSLPASTSFAFPTDPFVANGLSVTAAEVYSGVGRRLTIWGGSITSIRRSVHTGSVNGNSTGDYLVTFRSTGSAVLLAWGGHLAQSAFWDRIAGGPRDGAGEVSGAPWHMRTLNLDNSGARNQDRSIQPSAIVGELPPNALGPKPPSTPAPNPPNAPAAPGSKPKVTSPPTTTIAVPATDAGPAPGIAVFFAIAALAVLAATSRRRRSARR
jgi:hypothetical protein